MQHSTFVIQRALSYLLRAVHMLSKSDIGAAIKDVRTKRRISQESLGASQSFISTIERGHRSPTIEKFQQLAAFLGISPVTLLAYAYLKEGDSVDELLSAVRQQLAEIGE